MPYVKYLCIRRTYFGGSEAITLNDFRQHVQEAYDDADADAYFADWATDPKKVVVIPYEEPDYHNVSEFAVADPVMFQSALAQDYMVARFREYAKDARDEDVLALIEKIRAALTNQSGIEYRQALIAVAEFFNIGTKLIESEHQ